MTNEAQKTLIRFGGVARGFLSVTCFLLRPRADGDGVFTVMRIGCAMRNAQQHGQNGDVAFLSVSCTKAGFSNAFSFYGSAPGARPGGCTLPCRGVHHARRPDTARPNRYVSCGDSTLCGGSTRVRSVLLLRTGQPEDTSPFHTVLYRTEYRTISLPSRQHTHLSYWIIRAELSRMHARR